MVLNVQFPAKGIQHVPNFPAGFRIRISISPTAERQTKRPPTKDIYGDNDGHQRGERFPLRQ
jgi:hypothetical protein